MCLSGQVSQFTWTVQCCYGMLVTLSSLRTDVLESSPGAPGLGHLHPQGHIHGSECYERYSTQYAGVLPTVG